MNTSTPLLVAIQGDILILTLNRPSVLNAIDAEMAVALQEQLTSASQNPAIRAILITGSGLGFCSGGDLKFAVETNPKYPGDAFLALTAILHDCVEQIRTMSKPVIAAINGAAAGAGLFLALACDLRIMVDSAYLKQSNTSHGLSLPVGGTFTLPRLIGMGRALEIVMLDEAIFAAQSLELGLVTKVVPHQQLQAEALALAARVSQMPIEALGRVKRLMNEAYHNTLTEQLLAERQQIAMSANSPEGREGLAAFLQKRQPNYAAVKVSRSALYHSIRV
ncbi:enoyl-CoA hydratase/isomerase family protein [Leptolyngbya sp. NK1-12]|uniref:Enoyl-CoA hydratase/isomerase family protein n=1 Tax=Leptolyngbya sp. NK1-12 TaxID=2547451 RepID=A0AA97AJE7_9CYAN|nr:enoyl-CoA hydratase/isomerase family protein [Leptolyngbya sp. NK1-12]